MTGSELRWFRVYKGSQRLENHRCQVSLRPYPLRNLPQKSSSLFSLWSSVNSQGNVEFFTWELSPVLDQAIGNDNIFNTSSSPKYLFHSLRVIKIFRKGLNYVAMPALDWPEICFFKFFIFFCRVGHVCSLASFRHCQKQHLFKANVRLIEEKCTFSFSTQGSFLPLFLRVI